MNVLASAGSFSEVIPKGILRSATVFSFLALKFGIVFLLVLVVGLALSRLNSEYVDFSLKCIPLTFFFILLPE